MIISVLFVLLVFGLAMPVAHAQGTTPQTSDEHFAEGNTFYRDSKWDKAIHHFTESIKLRAGNAPAYLMRGTAYHDQKELDKAVADYSKAIELDPAEYLAYSRRAEAYEKQGKTELAAADKREFQKRFDEKAKPVTPEEYLERGEYYADRGFWGDAVNDYGEAIRLDPHIIKGFPFSRTYEKRGDLHRLMGKVDEALKDYTNAIGEAEPPRAVLYFKRAELLYKESLPSATDRRDEALSDYSQAIRVAKQMRLEPEVLLPAYLQRAKIYTGQGEHDKAIADYTQVIALDPNHAVAYSNRASLYRKLNQTAEAEADEKKAMDLQPDCH